MRKAPALRNNNGALQLRVRLDGKDHFINHLGRFDDPVAQAKAQSISAEIWSDFQQSQLDWSLSRYQPLVEGKDPELLDALERLMKEKRQGRTTHAYRVVRRYGEPIRTQAEVEGFVEWMSSEGLAASTQATILSTIRSVQPKNKALGSVAIKVPTRSVQEEGLGKDEIRQVLADLKQNEAWYYPCFALWLGTGLRNAEVIGLTWDCVRLDEGELLISKSLRRDGTIACGSNILLEHCSIRIRSCILFDALQVFSELLKLVWCKALFANRCRLSVSLREIYFLGWHRRKHLPKRRRVWARHISC